MTWQHVAGSTPAPGYTRALSVEQGGPNEWRVKLGPSHIVLSRAELRAVLIRTLDRIDGLDR